MFTKHYKLCHVFQRFANHASKSFLIFIELLVLNIVLLKTFYSSNFSVKHGSLYLLAFLTDIKLQMYGLVVNARIFDLEVRDSNPKKELISFEVKIDTKLLE